MDPIWIAIPLQSGTEGDGYQSRTPHTKHEKFEGLTTLSAAEVCSSP